MNPSAFYRQHFATIDAPRIDERAFIPFWRIRTRTRLDRLLDERAISPAAWRAAIQFRDAATYLAGERRYDRSSGGSRAEPGLYRFHARGLMRRVALTLGPLATALVWSCAVDDLSWAAIGARLRVHPKTARRWTIVALQALASLNEHMR